MNTQGSKTHFFAGATLFLAMVVAARDLRVKGNSWTAAWSWPGDVGQNNHVIGLSDEEIVDLLYSRPSRSLPDHPSFEERKRYQKALEDYGLDSLDSYDYSKNYQDYDGLYATNDNYDDGRAAFNAASSSSASLAYMKTSTIVENNPRITSYAHRIVHSS